ncbi:hypothetical protein Ancab_018988 [Ancistrocladus abbreviatus]
MGVNMNMLPSAPLSGDLSYMVGLDGSHLLDPRYLPLSSQPLALVTEIFQAMNSIPINSRLYRINSDGGSLTPQDGSFAANFTKIDVHFNDKVVHNFQKLEMEQSSFEGHSISSVDPNHRKRTDDGKSIPKKKKTQPTSPQAIES